MMSLYEFIAIFRPEELICSSASQQCSNTVNHTRLEHIMQKKRKMVSAKEFCSLGFASWHKSFHGAHRIHVTSHNWCVNRQGICLGFAKMLWDVEDQVNWKIISGTPSASGFSYCFILQDRIPLLDQLNQTLLKTLQEKSSLLEQHIP